MRGPWTLALLGLGVAAVALAQDPTERLRWPREWSWSSPLAMHDSYERAFLDGEQFGYYRMLIFTAPDQRPLALGDALFQVADVELVSLLKQTSPSVYVLDGNPTKGAAYFDEEPMIRDLNEFEATALARLQAGEDMVVDRNDGEPRAVGAIRARYDCRPCHIQEPGELLGALTYTFSPHL